MCGRRFHLKRVIDFFTEPGVPIIPVSNLFQIHSFKTILKRFKQFYEVNIKTFKEFISDFQVFEFGEKE